MSARNDIRNTAASSKLNLKAILSAKEEEFKLKRDMNPTIPMYINTGQKYQKHQKNSNLPNYIEIDKDDEHKELELSFIALKRKTIEYEKLQDQGGIDPDTDDLLVNFLEKNPIKETNSKRLMNDPWIEIIDEFGRNRLIRRSEKESFVDNEDEQEEETAQVKERHFNSKKEVRTLGTGYYQFSLEGQERQEQMKQMNDLRSETIINKEKNELMKKQRQELLEKRRQELRDRKRENEIKMQARNQQREDVVDLMFKEFL